MRDYQRLRNKDEKLCRVLSDIPHLDQLFYGIPADVVDENWRRGFAYDEPMEMTTQVSEQGSVNDSKQAGMDNQTSEDEAKDIDNDLMASFRSRWGYGTVYEDDELVLYSSRCPTCFDEQHHSEIMWSDSTLRAHSMDSDLQLSSDGIRNGYEGDVIPLCSRISSRLLLYRIIGVFGMPPSMGPFWVPSMERGWFETAWAVKLVHDRVNSLSLFNTDGQPHLEFQGTTEASDDAIALVNLLTR